MKAEELEEIHILRHFGDYRPTFDKAFLEVVVGPSMGSFVNVVIV